MTYQEMADKLGMPLPSLYTMVHRRRIPHLRLSGRMVRFNPTEVEQWLDAHAIPAIDLGAETRAVAGSEVSRV